MGIVIALSGFFSWQLMAVLLLVYVSLAVADLFKRHLLSNTAVYWTTMLLAPFAAVTAVAAPVNVLLNAFGSWGKIILTFIGGTALLLLTAAVYIRGHIAPLSKTSGKYGDNKRYFAAKRLMTVGYTGTFLYALPFIVMSCEMIMYLSIGAFAVADIVSSEGLSGVLALAVMLLLIFLIPIVNIFAVCALFFLGIEFAVWGITAAAVLLANILIANGCIRYILTTDKTKGKKAFWIFLSLIPVFNLVYGFCCISQINKNLNNNY